MKDFAGWKQALLGRSGRRFKSYPKLNHFFVAGEGRSAPAEYEKPGHVAAEVVEDIASFVKARGAPRAKGSASAVRGARRPRRRRTSGSAPRRRRRPGRRDVAEAGRREARAPGRGRQEPVIRPEHGVERHVREARQEIEDEVDVGRRRIARRASRTPRRRRRLPASARPSPRRGRSRGRARRGSSSRSRRRRTSAGATPCSAHGFVMSSFAASTTRPAAPRPRARRARRGARTSGRAR